MIALPTSQCTKIISVSAALCFTTNLKTIEGFQLVLLRLLQLTMQVLQVFCLLVALGLAAATLPETVDYSG
jgi:uncharacterized membrane protein